MKCVEPIRDKTQLEELKTALLHCSYRDYMIFNVGINSGLRISDLLQLKVSDVLDKTHFLIVEKKTKKVKRLKIQPEMLEELKVYIKGMKPNEYLFKSQKGENKPLSRVQYWRILNNAAEKVGITESLGCHSMRKTFGYWQYQKNKDVAMLQNLFNHSSQSITLRYIGINNDLMDEAIDGLKL